MYAFQDFLFWLDSAEWTPYSFLTEHGFLKNKNKWAPCKLWSIERQEGEGSDSDLKTVKNYSIFLFPKIFLRRKLEHLLFLCENDLECSLEQKRPFMNWLQLFFGLSYTIVFIWEPEIYSEWILTENKTSSHCNLHLPVWVFLLSGELKLFLFQKTKYNFSFLAHAFLLEAYYCNL